MITKIAIQEHTGAFAEDKDKAQALRKSVLAPALKAGKSVVIDFKGVTGATQSFVHALISALIRSSKGDALDLLDFRNCNPTVRRIITIVSEYSQQTASDDV